MVVTAPIFVSEGRTLTETVDNSYSKDANATKTVTENYSPNSQGGNTP